MKKIILFISIIICLFAINSHNTHNNNNLIINDTLLTEHNVYTYLILNDIKFPDVVISQIMLESAHLKSKLCKRNNNLLGMTVPSKRETTAINDEGYAKYKSWMDCIIDYKLYQNYILSRHHITTKKQYIAFLQRSYAESKDYKHNLINISRNYEYSFIIL